MPSFLGVLHINDLHVVRNHLDGGYTGAANGGVLLQILIVFTQGQTHSLGQTAIDLTVNNEFVAQFADVSHADQLLHRALAACDLNRDLGQEQAVHVVGKGRALAFGVAVRDRLRPLVGWNHVEMESALMASETRVIPEAQ